MQIIMANGCSQFCNDKFPHLFISAALDINHRLKMAYYLIYCIFITADSGNDSFILRSL